MPPKLIAANGTEIKSYGYKYVSFSLPGFKETFRWKFAVGDVTEPILGNDFLASEDLLIDCRRKRLLRLPKALRVSAIRSETHKIPQLSSILNKYAPVFNELSNNHDITHPVEHEIVTTGRPVYNKPRRLFGDKLDIARKHFDKLENRELSIAASRLGLPACTWPQGRIRMIRGDLAATIAR